MDLSRAFWEQRYGDNETGWDLGGPSTPLRAYIDQLTDRELRMLIPGAGRAYEAEYAHRAGFRNVHVIDLTDAPFVDLKARCPDFPSDHLIVGDFFAHEGSYDVILEQTFFCALDPALRDRYVRKMWELLRPGGKLVGVLFNDALFADHPPFGGFKADYEPLLKPYFPAVSMEPCHNSIAPRAGRELWLHAQRPLSYSPVACALYDRFEAAAVTRRPIKLSMIDGGTVEGIIDDLFIRDGADWLRLKSGGEYRLDAISGAE
ncbi:MAG: methyltransferase domain-containing protein [Flavobacteriales bacterium]|nr:methyltransferase domain-containing protein [Flavobacteriales bacterium]